MRPLIGIPAGRPDPTQEAPYATGPDYVHAVTAAGGLPVLLPASEAPECAEEALARLDGLLLSGGGDVDPALYGEAPLPALGGQEPDRDRWEIALARTALAAGVPVLGICRGIQVLNVAAGGTLVQDLPSQRPESMQHAQKAPRWYPSHRIVIARETRLAQLLQVESIRVNSFHHQALAQVAPGWRVSAHSDDGVVEAIELPGHPFAVGVQFHAENMVRREPLFLRLFAALTAAAHERTLWPAAAPLAVATRGGEVESLHRGHIAVVDTQGTLLFQAGDPSIRTTMRSSAKPLQAMFTVLSGAADRFALSDQELAVISGSHSGTEEHVRTVAGILAKLSLGEEALQCGVHPPFDAETRRSLILAGREPGPLHHNCSGKHSGMLADALTLGVEPERYLDYNSPVQQGIEEVVAAMAGLPREEVGHGTDGCSVPTWILPLQRMAYAFARLGHAAELPDLLARAATRVAEAMRGYPVMVGGRGRFDTELMEATAGRLLVKSGAEGVLCVAVPERGWGIAIKEEDGGVRGLHPALLATLEQLDLISGRELATLAEWRRAVIRNYRDLEVGGVDAVSRLTPVFPPADPFEREQGDSAGLTM